MKVFISFFMSIIKLLLFSLCVVFPAILQAQASSANIKLSNTQIKILTTRTRKAPNTAFSMQLTSGQKINLRKRFPDLICNSLSVAGAVVPGASVISSAISASISLNRQTGECSVETVSNKEKEIIWRRVPIIQLKKN